MYPVSWMDGSYYPTGLKHGLRVKVGKPFAMIMHGGMIQSMAQSVLTFV
jgi:hypothetical protein